MKFVFSCPSSHPAPRWAAHGLARRGHDVKFFTSSAVPADRQGWIRHTPSRVQDELRRRSLPDCLDSSTVINSAVLYDTFRVVAERANWMEVNMVIHRRMIKKVQLLAIRHIEKHGRPDAIYATGSMSNLIAEYAYEHSIPLFLYLPQPVMNFINTIDPQQSKMMRTEEKVQAAELMAATTFVASSALVEASIRHEGIKRPVIKLPLGFSPGSPVENSAAVRSRSNSHDPFRLLFVGRASYQKGLPILFESLAQLAKRLPIKLTVVTRETDKVLRLGQSMHVNDLIDVRATVPRDELYRLMRQHHAFVLPSKFEGYGLVIVEALANGVPVITTPLTAGSDLQIDQRAGFLVEPDNTESLSEAIEKLAIDPELGKRFSFIAEEITKDIDWESYAKRIATAIETHVGKRRHLVV